MNQIYQYVVHGEGMGIVRAFDWDDAIRKVKELYCVPNESIMISEIPDYMDIVELIRL